VGGLLLAALACSAQASNLSFLNDTPVSYMRQPDIDSIKLAVRHALDTKADGESVQWNNADTGNRIRLDATITLGDTTNRGASTCRSVTVVLRGKGQSMNLHPLFCRADDARWRFQQRR
jgi:surface antigen